MPVLLFFLLLLGGAPADTLLLRDVPADALEQYRADPAFIYEQTPEEAETLWDRVLTWIWREVVKPLFAPALAPVRNILFYGLIVFGVVFALLNLLRMDRGLLFKKGNKPASHVMVDLAEDPAGLDIDRLLAAAVAAQAYRRAVRLTYLKALRDLAGRGLIRWRLDKTNHAYLDELPHRPLRSSFAELTHLFEYAWYGAFSVDARMYGRVQAAYERLSLELATG